ncbi:transcriptional adapter 1-like [Acropora millepora]|uniref:transcriptional adapter 1-like n=1 Tax=Acropora millepora TaxID=45264 RepID=UPI001CF1842B|nr:transcriptional adapter 1-like [Acropora millepora]
MAVDLTAARRQLDEALGDFSQTYWNNMKLWYKQKISKEEFDTQAKKCLSNDTLHFHNEFLLAILAKCQALGATPASHPRTPQKLPPKPQLIKKGKIKKAKKVLKANFEQRFSPCNPLCDAPELSLKELSEDSEFGLCTYDMMLPDTATIYGRLFLGAWDAGLDNVSDDTVSLMLHATEYLVKDVLTACCSMRSSFRLRDGHFRYAMGGTYPRMHLRNSSSPWPPNGEKFVSSNNTGRTLEQAEAEAAVTVACSETRGLPRPPISLMDLRDALQVHRRVIPSHTVYSANIERTLANMSHPGHDELEQNQLHKLETRRRYERLKQQRSLRL